MSKRQPPENPVVPEINRLTGEFLELYRSIEITLDRGEVPSPQLIQERGGYAPNSQFGVIPRKLKELKKLGLIAEPEYRLVGGGTTKLGIAALERHRKKMQSPEYLALKERSEKRAKKTAARKKKAKRSNGRK